MSVATLSIILILISALSHALVGAIMKRSDDKLVLRGILGATSFVIALPIALMLPLPPWEVWKIMIIGVSVHFIYQFAQAAAFTKGDMSIVYPVMRGFAPALAAFFAFLFLKESLEPVEILGLCIVVSALVGFGWPQKIKIEGAKAALAFALFCGLLTAIYTVIDAYGMRLAPHKFAFIAWFFVMEGLGISIMVSFIKRKNLKTRIATDFKGGIMAGLFGLVTYTTALYAFSIAPIAGLAALRETSVIFGAILATLWLKESFGIRRGILAIILALGLILMHTA
ncbi:DMT family transporter [Hellea sp.]|nr:DMT family transporter [Hellea sp.]